MLQLLHMVWYSNILTHLFSKCLTYLTFIKKNTNFNAIREREGENKWYMLKEDGYVISSVVLIKIYKRLIETERICNNILHESSRSFIK